MVLSACTEVWHESCDWKLTDLKRVFAASQKATAENGWYPIYFENHDHPRSVSHFLPNATDAVAAAKMLGCVLMTMRGTPFLYDGRDHPAFAQVELCGQLPLRQ